MPIGRYETEEAYFARLKKRHAREVREKDRWSITELPNGLIEVRDRKSGLVATLNEDGSYRHGDLGESMAEAVYEEWVDRSSEQVKLGG